MVDQFSDYRSYLRAELDRRISKNPAYSLRSFAAQLGLSHSYLSRVLSGQKRLSLEGAARVSLALKLKGVKYEHFLDLVQIDATQSEPLKLAILKRIEARSRRRQKQLVDLEAFRVISDWYHFAILGLAQTRDFRMDEHWIAKRLGIDLTDARDALDRLTRLGLLSSKGAVVANQGQLKTPDDIRSLALQKYHYQIIQRAAQSIESQPVDRREFRSVAIAFNPEKIREAKVLIREFAAKMNAEMEEEGASELYQLNIQFFQLSREVKT